MIDTGTHLTFRLAALVLVLVLAIGAASCGSDDDDGDKGSATAAKDDSSKDASSGATEPVKQSGTPEEQIRAAYAAFVDGFYKKDPAAICAGMTEKAQVKFGKTFQTENRGGAATCEAQMRKLIDSAESFSKNKPTIVRLKIKGNKATIGAKTRNSDVYTVPYTKEKGVWKVSGGFAPA